MGLPNSYIIQDLNSLQFNLALSRTPMFQFIEESQTTAPSQELVGSPKQKVSVSCLKIEVPSFAEVEAKKQLADDNGDEDEDQCRTPTSQDHRIQVIFPPAPRKPKTLPSSKRKGYDTSRLLLDFSKEIEALFPQTLLADLGGKIKKAKKLR